MCGVRGLWDMFGCLMFVWSVWRWECMGMCDGGMSV